MDRDAKLKEFAAALFSHVYREYNTTFDLPVKLPNVFSHHAPQDCSKEEAAAVLRLCMAMRGVFNGLFVKGFETFQQSTQHFMTFLTSRSLKLCAGDDDVFLSFCMVCAFVAELNLFCLINGCFAFMATAPKCLQAIFNRRLRKEFYANGGWESLKFFAEHFARDVPPEDVVSEELLASIKEKLDEDSSEDDSSSDSDSEEDEDKDEEDEDKDDEESEDNEIGGKDNEDTDKSLATAPTTAAVVPPPARVVPAVVNPIPSTSRQRESSDDSSDSESELDSDDSDSEESDEMPPAVTSKQNGLKRTREESSDSEDESEEGEVKMKPNGLKRPKEDSSDTEDSEEGEVKIRPNGLKQTVDSDDDSDSSEESDTSSMSDEESEDSESDVAPSKVQTNCIKPVVQEKLNVDKKVL